VGKEMASQKNETKNYEFSQQSEVKSVYIDKKKRLFVMG